MSEHHGLKGNGRALTALAIVLAVSFLPIRSSQAAEAVVYRLKWLFNVSVVGDLYADEKGLFAEKNLAVTVKEGGPERDAIKEIELGHAQFGVASADQVIRARSKGSPVVVIAQLFQVNPLQWIYRSGRVRIGNLSDLRGKTLGVTFGGNDESILRTLLAMAGLTERDVNLFSVRYDYTPFLRDRVDIWPVYRNAQGIILQDQLGAEGEETAFFNPAEYGVRFVANSVVTSEAMVRERGDMVRRFLSSLLAGWQMALEASRQPQVLEMLARFDPNLPPRVLAAQLDATRSMVRPEPNFSVGAFDAAAWRQTERIMLEQGLIPQPVGVERSLEPAFLP
ncbi:MAG: ABC transporter substrate-binding protein [Desulfobacteraceae bacterium]|jgi:NitT/TauT family transport system substrate-binding protein|nr:ABC transporter substrate-binding protein [Desulfobacteraceae bacterium]